MKSVSNTYYSIIRFTCILLTVMQFSTSLSGRDSLEIQFNNARFSYQKAQYATAIQLYEKLLKQSQPSAALHYNLALCYAQHNQLGKAIAQFEKALILAPDDEDIVYNLELANSTIKQPLTHTGNSLFSNLIKHGIALFSLFNLCLLFLVLWYAGWFLYCYKASQKEPEQSRSYQLFSAAAIALFLGIFLSCLPTQKDAIVIPQKIGLRAAPSLALQESSWLYEGVKVQVALQKDSWTKVIYREELSGWVPSDMLEIITP